MITALIHAALILLCSPTLFCRNAQSATAENASAPSTEDAPYCLHFKERRTLATDPTKVALFDGGRHESPEALAARAGLTSSSLESIAMPGWVLATVQLGKQSVGNADTLQARIAALPDAPYVAPVFLGNDGGPVIAPPTVLVRFVAGVPAADAEATLAALAPGVILERDWGGMSGAYRVEVDAATGLETLSVANQLAERSDVMFAEPDFIFTGHGDLIPNDTFFPDCWGLHNTGQSGGTADMDTDAPEAWDITTGDASIKVVIIDVGVQQNHPDLNQVAGFDATGNNSGGGPVINCDNHGTAVAGCVSAIINNSIGVVGVAPGCKSASARTFNSNPACDGSWTTQISWTVDSLNWAQSIGARVSNNSNYYGFTSASIEQKYADTYAAGMVHFASAGNNGSATIAYPASIANVNSVAALDRNGNRASFSQYGPGLDFSAPGVTIYTTDRTGNDGYVAGDYVITNGTSFASPYAAGVAALLLSRSPGLSASQAEQIMQQSAVNLGPAGYDTDFGWGFVNANNALNALCPGSAGPIVYVRASATGANNGSSWANAYVRLRDAIDGTANCPTVTQIWVAAGAYRPDETNANPNGDGDRNATFQLRNGLSIIGGFRGLPGDEGINDNTTRPLDGTTGRPTLASILSGDLAENDGPAAFEDYGDNSFHVVNGSGVNATAILDGLTIRSGNATGPGGASPTDEGGGIYINVGSPVVVACTIADNLGTYFAGIDITGVGANPQFSQCYIGHNQATFVGGGGAIRNNCSVTFSECMFESNVATSVGTLGGGGFAAFLSTTANFDACVFTGNRATTGGALCAENSGAVMTNCEIINNTATSNGGALLANSTSPRISECTFRNNSATDAGAIQFNGSCAPIIYGTRFIENTATNGSGGAVYIADGAGPNFVSCRFLSNAATDSGGGVAAAGTQSSAFTNCIFSGNRAQGGASKGGGLAAYGSGPVYVNNCTFNGNRGLSAGDSLYSTVGGAGPGQILAANCILASQVPSNNAISEGGSISLVYSDVLGGFSGAGNINADPRFIDADGADNTVGTIDDDLRLLSDSPCIDAAHNSEVGGDTLDLDGDGNTSERIPFDIDGNSRFLDTTCTANTGVSGEGYSQIVDMGAYEYVEPDCDGDGIGDPCDSIDFIEITAQPQSQTACAGDPIAFSVTAAGAPPLSYQWRRNGVNLTEGPGSPYGGVHQNVLLINPVTPAVAGSYNVVITGACGSVTSSTAILTVSTIPGDIDFSGEVDIADLSTLLSHFGTQSGATFGHGDLDGDGDVDLGDLTALLSAFGTFCV